MGVDILNPVQTSARGHGPGKLKRNSGTGWCSGASLDCQKTLPFGTPDEVARSRKARPHFAPGGGYVFASVHNIQADIPPENLVAMFDTALRVGLY